MTGLAGDSRAGLVPLLLLLAHMTAMADSGATVLDTTNIDTVLAGNELVLLNFYADWCRFSNMLAPIWDEAADKIASELPDKKVVVGKVDCDKQGSLGSRFHISKYPTIKFAQNGVLAKKEYRGQRSAAAFLEFVREHVKDPVASLQGPASVAALDKNKRHLVGYFVEAEGAEWEAFKQVSVTLKEDCQFHAGTGSEFESVRAGGQNRIIFKGGGGREGGGEVVYDGSPGDQAGLLAWATQHCSPLVREITFENAEELTEEGLPFLILFHNPADTESVREYTELVSRELTSEKGNVNFLTADGLKFAHPLHHLGKSKDDLPLIAIDSFRHMYLFPRFEDIRSPGRVKSFLQDLYSGKLHREFHYGPDKEEEKKKEIEAKEREKREVDEKEKEKGDEDKVKEEKHIPRTEDVEEEKKEKSTKPISTDPPESMFNNLKPSKNRYTILRDEF